MRNIKARSTNTIFKAGICEFICLSSQKNNEGKNQVKWIWEKCYISQSNLKYWDMLNENNILIILTIVDS